jgi:hypothetical protein
LHAPQHPLVPMPCLVFLYSWYLRYYGENVHEKDPLLQKAREGPLLLLASQFPQPVSGTTSSTGLESTLYPTQPVSRCPADHWQGTHPPPTLASPWRVKSPLPLEPGQPHCPHFRLSGDGLVPTSSMNQTSRLLTCAVGRHGLLQHL